jgi:iron-sulfur cluster repair protein YtfE (RIC family)
VLARHGIDLCCGGDKTLAFVAQAHRIDLQALLRELAEAR